MSGVESVAVGPDDDGVRLDRWFRRHYPTLTHGRLEKLLRTGQVRVDGSRARANLRLAEGQVIRVPPLKTGAPDKPVHWPPPIADKDAEAALEALILHEDGHLIVLNKPAGLASQGGSGLSEHVDGLLATRTDRKGERPRLVHRLDRETSGLLVVAKSRKVAADLSAAFRTRKVRKTYWGLVLGVPHPLQGTIKQSLEKRMQGGEERMVPVPFGQGQRAMSHYAVVAHAGKRVAFLALRPVTGRTHQLRVHCAVMETPLVGDAKYGQPHDLGPNIEDRLHLHARELAFDHPAGGRVRYEAPLPPHMAASWQFFGFPDRLEDDPFAELDR